ncbi:hypothetical protein [Catenuloplanes indicus]|uniref:Ribosomal protein S27AE n=1 Tax=Catenuloplanes indicus TaxID=137267 RepID=A0AAE4B2F4_9ACTN|nr:hypothetical protein [Catenuloplanes indicus]MDQ0371644.1 ribosomal protein S27AE [Catenuloplanes indicus]
MTLAVILIASWFAAKFLIQEGAYAVRGKTPPRHEVRMAEIKAGIAKPTYGWSGFFNDLLDDSLRATAQTTGGAIQDAARRKLNKRRANDGLPPIRMDGTVEPTPPAPDSTTPGVVPDPATGPGTPVDGSRAKTPTGTSQPDLSAPQPAGPGAPRNPAEQVLELPPCERCGTNTDPEAGSLILAYENSRYLRVCRTCAETRRPEPAAPGAANSTTRGQRELCPRCSTGQIIGSRPWPNVDGGSPDADRLCNRCGWMSAHVDDRPKHVRDAEARNLACENGTTGGVAIATDAGPRHPERQSPPTPASNVIPINRDKSDAQPGVNTATTGGTMTDTASQPTSEITGLVSAVNYATQVAQAHATHGGGEQYIGSLRSFEVGEDVIAKVALAQEASQNAAAAWTGAADAIASTNAAVAEAYRSSGGQAGNKQFATGE